MDTHDEASITRISRGRLVVGWNVPDHQQSPRLRRDMERQNSEVTTKPMGYLGRTLLKTTEGYNFGVDASYVESMLEEFSMSGLKSSPNTEMGTP